MKVILMLRDRLLDFYDRHTKIVQPLLRLLLCLMIFGTINQSLGYNPQAKPWYVTLILAALAVFLPMEIWAFMAAGLVAVQIYHVSVVLSVTFLLVCAFLYFVYLQFSPKYGMLILITPLLFAWRIPYVLPLFLGLTGYPVAAVPLCCGIFVYQFLEGTVDVLATASGDHLTLYHQVIDQFFEDRQFFWTLAIFVAVLIVVFIIRTQNFSYAREISYVAGAVLMVLLFLIANYTADLGMETMPLIVQITLSTLIVWVIQLFRLSLNYAGAEQLQFQDDEYYYFVKAVPKMSVSAADKQIKRFNAHLFGENRFRSRAENKQQQAQHRQEES